MYRSIDDFLKDWKNEEAFTLKIFEMITEQAKSSKVFGTVRSLERLAWHLTQTITEMGHRAGLLAEDMLEHQSLPGTMQEIADQYKASAELLCKSVKLKWTDSALGDKVPMYGEDWPKGQVLRVLIAHQSHHRGQMTVIMRILGLPVPGIYGPSREEWIGMGLEAQD